MANSIVNPVWAMNFYLFSTILGISHEVQYRREMPSIGKSYGNASFQIHESVPFDGPFQNNHACGNFRLQAVFRRYEDLEVFVRCACLQAAFELIIDSKGTQHFSIFAPWLHPDDIGSLCGRQRLWRGHMSYLDFYLRVSIAVIAGEHLAHGCGRGAGIGQSVLAAPGRNGEQKTQYDKQS